MHMSVEVSQAKRHSMRCIFPAVATSDWLGDKL
jgi:hypothetical protein